MPADDDGHVAEGLPAALGVDDHRPVGAQPGPAVGRVGVVAADAPVAGVAVDHRVHVAGGDPPHQPGPAQGGEGSAERQSGWAMMPTRSPSASSRRPMSGRAEAGVVDVGVAGHQHDVAGRPAQGAPARPGDMGRKGAAAPAGRGRREQAWAPGGRGRPPGNPTRVRRRARSRGRRSLAAEARAVSASAGRPGWVSFRME